jgi:hypothetical protein
MFTPLPRERPGKAMNQKGMNYQRLFATAIAIIGWAALALQLSLTLGIVIGQGRSVWAGLWLFLGYFTVLTNILVAVSMSLVAMDRWPGGPRPSVSALTAVALAITIVGIVYHLLLSGRVPDLSSLGWVADRTMHYLVPVLSLAFWVMFVPKSSFTFTDPFLWILYPLGYLVYAMARGSLDGWYPYFFIDVGVIGYAKSLLNAAVLSTVVLIIGFAIVITTRFSTLVRPKTERLP